MLPLASIAQTYPFDEGFHGIASGTLPAEWSGDMKVQADHGLNDLKGMTADIGGNDILDSATTPWIGPLDNNTEFYFWYRIVEQFIYPSTEKHLNGNDRVVISYTTDSINYTPIYSIDSANHQPTLNFRKVIFAITNLGGQVVKFKFWAKHGGGGSYFVDIDSIKVRQNTGTGVVNINHTDFNVFPNPVRAGAAVQLFIEEESTSEVMVFDLTGKLLVKTTTANGHLSTTGLNRGIYILRYGLRTRKLVVE